MANAKFNANQIIKAFHDGIANIAAGKLATDAGTGTAWAACLAVITAGKADEYLGNGAAGKENIAGKFRDAFNAAESKACANSIKNMLSQARKVAAAYEADPKLDLTLSKNALVETARLAMGGKPKGKAESTGSDAPMTLEQVIASAGIAATLRAVAAILKAERKSATDAKAIEAISVKYGT